MRAISLAIVAFMMFVMIPLAALSNTAPEATAAPVAQQAPVVTCTQARISLKQVRITCSALGVVVLNSVIDLPSVQVTLPPVTVTLPGATATVRVPGPTVKVPGPPGPTATVTQIVPGAPGATITRAPQTVTASPTATVTENPTVSPSGQPTTDGGTIGPDSNDTVLTFPKVELNTPEAVGLGIGAILFLMLLILLGMWAGYYLGYKDSEKNEANFLKTLLGK